MSFTTRSIPRSIEDLVREQQALGNDVIGPQPGPQEQFLASPARLIVYGGAAGGG